MASACYKFSRRTGETAKVSSTSCLIYHKIMNHKSQHTEGKGHYKKNENAERKFPAI